MINVICNYYKNEDSYDTMTLQASRRQRLWNDENNPRIKWMEEPSDDIDLNCSSSPYKVVMEWDCGGWCRKIFRYKGQNYIGGLNLLRFRLYRGKLNYLDAIRFLNNHLHKMDFPNDRYRNYIYPLIR